MKKIIDSAILLAIATGTLYILGAAYNQAYNSVFGLDNEVMSKDFHRVLLDGFTSLLNQASDVIIASIFLFFLIFIIFLFSWFAPKELFKLIKTWLKESKKRKIKMMNVRRNLINIFLIY